VNPLFSSPITLTFVILLANKSQTGGLKLVNRVYADGWTVHFTVFFYLIAVVAETVSEKCMRVNNHTVSFF
jgi:hypothetical protein